MQIQATLPELTQSTNLPEARALTPQVRVTEESRVRHVSWRLNLCPGYSAALLVTGCSSLLAAPGLWCLLTALRSRRDGLHADSTYSQRWPKSAFNASTHLDLVYLPEILFRGFQSPPKGKLPWVSRYRDEYTSPSKTLNLLCKSIKIYGVIVLKILNRYSISILWWARKTHSDSPRQGGGNGEWLSLLAELWSQPQVLCYLPWCHFTAASEQSSETGVAKHITETRKLSPENEAKLELGIQSSIEKSRKRKERNEVTEIVESLKQREQSRRAGGIKITLNGHPFGSLSCAEMLFVYFILNVLLIPCSIKVNSTIYFFLSLQFMSFSVILLLPNSSYTIFNARVSSLEERAAGEVDAALFVSNSPTWERLYSYRECTQKAFSYSHVPSSTERVPWGKGFTQGWIHKPVAALSRPVSPRHI